MVPQTCKRYLLTLPYSPPDQGGFFQRGTNFFYPVGTNGFYRRGRPGERKEYYPDEAGVYRRGANGVYRPDPLNRRQNDTSTAGTNGPSPYHMR